MSNRIFIECRQTLRLGGRGAEITLRDQPEGEESVSLAIDSKKGLDTTQLTPGQHKLLSRLNQSVREHVERISNSKSGGIPDGRSGPLCYGEGYCFDDVLIVDAEAKDRSMTKSKNYHLPGFGTVKFLRTAVKNRHFYYTRIRIPGMPKDASLCPRGPTGAVALTVQAQRTAESIQQPAKSTEGITR